MCTSIVKEMCFWGPCNLLAEPQGSTQHSLNTTNPTNVCAHASIPLPALSVLSQFKLCKFTQRNSSWRTSRIYLIFFYLLKIPSKYNIKLVKIIFYCGLTCLSLVGSNSKSCNTLASHMLKVITIELKGQDASFPNIWHICGHKKQHTNIWT